MSRVGFLGRRSKGDNFGTMQTNHLLPSENLPSLRRMSVLSASSNGDHSFATQSGKDILNPSSLLSPVSPVHHEFLDRNPLAVLTRRSSVAVHSSGPSLHEPGHLEGVPKEMNSFVGTPDYLAPESILGLGQDISVDWWAAGVILYELLFGIPPFHDETPYKVFENILSRNIDYMEDDEDVFISIEAKDLMDRLMCTDIKERLGSNGDATEVKTHTFFSEINWDTFFTEKAPFVPKIEQIDDTSYFDQRGLEKEVLEAENNRNSDDDFQEQNNLTDTYTGRSRQRKPNIEHGFAKRRESNDFGTFAYKNLSLLEKANNTVVQKLRSDGIFGSRDSILSSTESLNKQSRQRSLPPLSRKSFAVPDGSFGRSLVNNEHDHERRLSLPHPGRALSSQRNSVVSQSSMSSRRDSVLSTTLSITAARHPSDGSEIAEETNAILPTNSLVKQQIMSPMTVSEFITSEPTSSNQSPISPFSNNIENLGNRVMTILIAESNAMSAKFIEHILNRHFKCTCVTVHDGAEAIRCAMADVQFDLIFLDSELSLIDILTVHRMIRKTPNINRETPLILRYRSTLPEVHLSLFDAILPNPVTPESIHSLMERFVGVPSSCGL